MNGSEKLLELAKAQIGYQEKAGAAGLNDPDANAGQNNYTKYSRDVDSWGLMGCQGQPWCCTYQFWLEAKTFGTEKALEHFCMTRQTYKGYHCFSTYQAFERKGRTSSRPQVGALIVFTYEHIGRVTAVRNGRVYTNEGNTSALYGDRNGGTVKEKSYALNDPNIKGYCLIDYDGETEVPGAETGIPFGQIRVFQNWLNTWYGNLLKRECGAVLEADGRFGPRTRQAALVVWKDILNRLYGKKIPLSGERFDEKCKEAAGTALVRYGSKGTFVVLAEGFLAEQGIYLGNIDGIFGTGMEEAVRRFQTDYLLETDGVIGRNTWTGLFAI